MLKQRIYIGGLDPLRLAVSEVLERLPRDQLRIDAIHRGSCYCQFDASLTQHPSIEESKETSVVEPVDIIRKQFHNVVWKGCKLKVDLAKPHFLDRLALERKERTKQEIPNDDTTTSLPSSLLSRRHWKIRKAYGELSWTVDTKPIHISDPSVFAKVYRNKLKKTKHRNRSVRLFFPDNMESVSGEERSWNELSTADEDRSESSSSEDKSYASEHSNVPKVSTAKNKYERSEEDEGDSNTDNSSQRSPKLSLQYKTESNSSTSDSENQQASLNKKRSHEASTIGKYVWSDDDTSSSEDDQITQPPVKQQQFTRKVEDRLQMEEFAASLDDSPLDRETDISDDSAVEISETDLAGEISSNLDVLKNIFPDMKIDLVGKDRQKEDPDSTQNKPSRAVGWAPTGEMLRYDPSKVSAEQFVVPVEETEAHATEDMDEGVQLAVREEDVYMQSELEEVFREVREVDDVSSNPAPTKDAAKDFGGGSFSFSFHVNASESQKEHRGTETFSFAFELPDSSTAEVGFADSVQPEVQQRRFRERSLFSFPSEDLHDYVKGFFSLNDGDRIISDPEAYRKDESVKDAWNANRKTLTADWKRKRKSAIARKKQQRR